MKTKSASLDQSPDQSPGVNEPEPSMREAKTVMAQVYLLTAIEELTDLRKTLRLHTAALDELRQQPSLPPAVVTELLDTIQRRDRNFGTHLTSIRTNVNNASLLLVPTDVTPAPPN